MKIFQIGFNFCGFDLVDEYCASHDMRVISLDTGELALQIHKNYVNEKPLLTGCEDYDYYSDMENLELNLMCNVTYYKDLDVQYPHNRFILNTGCMDTWIQSRIDHPTYLLRAMRARRISCREKMIEMWKREWREHHESVRSYFTGSKYEQLLEFDYQKNHPVNLYIFFNPIEDVFGYFEKLYNRYFNSRVEKDKGYGQQEGDNLNVVDIYCPYVSERESYIRKTLKRFSRVQYVRAILPEDLSKETYQKLSTTFMKATETTPCYFPSHCKSHQPIYHKFTKLCVHLSYIVCLRHSIENSLKRCIVIFEDDVYFTTSNEEFDRHVIKFIESPYDVAYLGYGYCRDGESIIEMFTDKESLYVPLPKTHRVLCKHAIIYKTLYVRRLLGELLPLLYYSDQQVNHANMLLNANVAITRNPIVFQDRKLLGSFNENKRIDIPIHT